MAILLEEVVVESCCIDMAVLANSMTLSFPEFAIPKLSEASKANDVGWLSPLGMNGHPVTGVPAAVKAESMVPVALANQAFPLASMATAVGVATP